MASGHNHGPAIIPEEGQAISQDPIDSTLWAHILIQILAFGILFPLGMVLGMVKSRWHVPLQVSATLTAVLGYVLGHMHGGREFPENNIHSTFANVVACVMFGQVLLGVYLRLHLEKGFHARARPVVRMLHDLGGKAFPVVSWTQMLFGGITSLGFCRGDHVGQCLAHFIMGSAFIAYGVVLTILLLVGQLWMRRSGRSPEFFDSVVIAAWGCVNTFTEHRWGTAWVRNDWQHTTMGVVWWCGGLAGIWLSKGRDGSPKRNFIPAFIILLTGWAMSAHPQDLPISAMTHKVFGYTLMTVGLSRMVEISFVLNDKIGISEDGYDTHSFQYVPVFFLYAAGFLFMGATEEQMDLMAKSGIDHVAYVLILYSLSFLLFLFVNMLIHVYDRTVYTESIKLNGAATGRDRLANVEQARLREAEEFELDGLMSDDEDEERATRTKLLKSESSSPVRDAGPASPSTLGKNSEMVA